MTTTDAVRELEVALSHARKARNDALVAKLQRQLVAAIAAQQPAPIALPDVALGMSLYWARGHALLDQSELVTVVEVDDHYADGRDVFIEDATGTMYRIHGTDTLWVVG